MKFLYNPKISPWGCVSENDNESAPDFLGDGIVVEQEPALQIWPGSDGVLTVTGTSHPHITDHRTDCPRLRLQPSPF